MRVSVSMEAGSNKNVFLLSRFHANIGRKGQALLNELQHGKTQLRQAAISSEQVQHSDTNRVKL